MGNYKLYLGDSLKRIKEINSDSVSLTVTSPPYFNAKEYNGEDDNVGNNSSYQDYLNKIDDLLVEILRITKPGGIVVWNTSPVLDNGKRYGIPFHTNQLFEDLGFEFLEDIIWLKPDGAAKLRCGGWIQNDGKPMTWHANITTEYLMVFKKPGKRTISAEWDSIKSYYTKIPQDMMTNVWKINPETHKTYHDAPFPEELVKRCILLFTTKDETVFEPFLGSGTTLKVAKDLNRNGIGIELDPGYMEIAKENIGVTQTSLFEEHTYELS